jgi:hypothetical protein
VICSIASRVKKLAERIEFDEFMERASRGQAFLSQRCKLANPLPVKKLTIEIEGVGRNALTPRTRIFADGKQLPLIKSFSMKAQADSPFVDINLVQSTVVMEKTDKYEPVRVMGTKSIQEMVPHVVGQTVDIHWVKDYDERKSV